MPTSSSLIAAIGAAGLHGLAIRVGPRGGADGVIDLSEADTQTKVEETLLVRLYEHLLSGSDDRLRNPYDGLNDDEIGQLRDRFDEYRHDGQFAGHARSASRLRSLRGGDWLDSGFRFALRSPSPAGGAGGR